MWLQLCHEGPDYSSSSRQENGDVRTVKRLWFLWRLQWVKQVQHSHFHSQMGRWNRFHAEGELCEQEVPVLHQPADVPPAKGHLQGEHCQFSAWVLPPFQQHCLYKQGEGTASHHPSSAPSGPGKQEIYTFITQKSTLVTVENITRSHKNSHVSYPTTALFQCDGWLKPNKVTFRGKPQPPGLFIRYVKLHPPGFSSSCLNMQS